MSRTPHTPPYPLYVIRSCELSEMNNEEHGHPTPTLPILGHQELRIKWDEQWGGEDTQPHPTHPMSLGVES